MTRSITSLKTLNSSNSSRCCLHNSDILTEDKTLLSLKYLSSFLLRDAIHKVLLPRLLHEDSSVVDNLNQCKDDLYLLRLSRDHRKRSQDFLTP